MSLEQLKKRYNPMTQHTPEVEEIGAFPDDPSGLRREFAIKFHRGDFLKNGEEFDNSELITDWWLEKITTLHQKHAEELERALETARHLVRRYGTRMRDGEFKAVMNGLQALTPTKTDKQ